MTTRTLVFGPHAQNQLTERAIRPEDVATVLAAPIFRRPSYNYRDEVYGSTTDGRTLKVVVHRGGDPVYVVTVMEFSRGRLRRLMAREASP